jgi:hypothetical protein
MVTNRPIMVTYSENDEPKAVNIPAGTRVMQNKSDNPRLTGWLVEQWNGLESDVFLMDHVATVGFLVQNGDVTDDIFHERHGKIVIDSDSVQHTTKCIQQFVDQGVTVYSDTDAYEVRCHTSKRGEKSYNIHFTSSDYVIGLGSMDMKSLNGQIFYFHKGE